MWSPLKRKQYPLLINEVKPDEEEYEDEAISSGDEIVAISALDVENRLGEAVQMLERSHSLVAMERRQARKFGKRTASFTGSITDSFVETDDEASLLSAPFSASRPVFLQVPKGDPDLLTRRTWEIVRSNTMDSPGIAELGQQMKVMNVDHDLLPNRSWEDTIDTLAESPQAPPEILQQRSWDPPSKLSMESKTALPGILHQRSFEELKASIQSRKKRQTGGRSGNKIETCLRSTPKKGLLGGWRLKPKKTFEGKKNIEDVVINIDLTLDDTLSDDSDLSPTLDGLKFNTEGKASNSTSTEVERASQTFAEEESHLQLSHADHEPHSDGKHHKSTEVVEESLEVVYSNGSSCVFHSKFHREQISPY